MPPTKAKDFDDVFRTDTNGERFRRAKAEADSGPTIAATSDGAWEVPASLEKTATAAFPVHALPALYQDFVGTVAEGTQTPPDLAAMLAIAVTGATVARRVRIQAWEGYSEPLNLYAVVALPPGNRQRARSRVPIKFSTARSCLLPPSR